MGGSNPEPLFSKFSIGVFDIEELQFIVLNEDALRAIIIILLNLKHEGRHIETRFQSS